jgi:hypothetical protein
MPCDTKLKAGQSITQRKEEIRDTVARLARALVTGQVKAIVSAQGAVAFQGWTDADRNRVTDSCAYRQIMATGTAQAKLKIQAAEQLAGRTVSRQAIGNGGQGLHAHNGVWHGHH